MRKDIVRVKASWENLHTDYFEDYSPGMLHYHVHDHYEISLILSGQMRILLENSVHLGAQNCLVLTPAGAAHCIMHDPQVLYRRINVNFRDTFIRGYVPEWRSLLAVFAEKGCVLLLTQTQRDELLRLAEHIRDETDLFRQRLMLLLLLSRIAQLRPSAADTTSAPPAYMTAALRYLHRHYAEKILAQTLAAHLGISRTTLMTGFRRYIGTTMNDYLTRFRLQEAMKLLRQGHTQQAAAERCGLSEAGNLIRCFRRYFHTTPHKYLQENPPDETENA